MSETTVTTPEAVQELIRAELIDAGVEDEYISADVKFDDLDIDSLDAAELMATIERNYGVKVPRAELADVTVGQLAKSVVESMKS